MTALYDIDTAFRKQYSDELLIAVQQKESKLLPYVQQHPMNSKLMYMERLGASDGVREITSRHSLVEESSIPHGRRRLNFRDWYFATYIDEVDELRTQMRFQGPYQRIQAAAFGRHIDDLILQAAIGTAYSVDQDEAETGVSLPAGQVIDEDFGTSNSSLTIAKLARAKRIFDDNDCDPRDMRILVCGPAEIEALLQTTQISSADYNSVKALSEGRLDSFMGFKFIMSTRLITSESNIYKCIAFEEQAIGFALGQGLNTRIAEIPEKHYMQQIYTRGSFAATRLEEERVVVLEAYRS